VRRPDIDTTCQQIAKDMNQRYDRDPNRHRHSTYQAINTNTPRWLGSVTNSTFDLTWGYSRGGGTVINMLNDATGGVEEHLPTFQCPKLKRPNCRTEAACYA
jgi:hypothetical protein